MDLNNVTLFGRLGKDPELRQTPSGDGVCSFAIANSSWKKNGSEWKEDTGWYDCTLFGDSAKRFVDRAKKGHRIIVVGSLKQRKWEDKDGNKREKVGISVRTVQYLEKKPKGEATETTENAPEVPF